VKKTILLCLLLGGTLIGCGDDDDSTLPANDVDRDAATDRPGDGICDLSACPEPDMGIACCAPNGACGSDPTGVGLVCVANAGEGNVCELDECPEPTVGNACCTPFGTCGIDPFETNIFCFANPPLYPDPPAEDAAAPNCDPADCPVPEVGLGCCMTNGRCGVDTFEIGWCLSTPVEVDGGTPPDISVTPPDDPSVDGQCPSFIGLAGEPVWGCCSDFGVCGTFAGETCFLPAGTPIPSLSDVDAGELEGLLLCSPPNDPQ
jgi:hypothetical protein